MPEAVTKKVAVDIVSFRKKELFGFGFDDRTGLPTPGHTRALEHVFVAKELTERGS